MNIINILLKVFGGRWKTRFPWSSKPYLPGTMSPALWRSSPNCLRIDMAMPVLLFLPLGWDQPNPPFAGVGGGWRIQRIKLPFFCAYTPPWSSKLDFPWLPTKTIVRCSSFDCGRQAQDDWGLWWYFVQIWGDGSWNFGLMPILYIKQLY